MRRLRREHEAQHRLFTSIVMMGIGLAGGGCAKDHEDEGEPPQLDASADAAAHAEASANDAAPFEADAAARDAAHGNDAAPVDAQIVVADARVVDGAAPDGAIDCNDYRKLCFCTESPDCPEPCASIFACIL